MQTDRQTDRQRNMTKLVVAFRNFAYALKTGAVCDVCPCSDVNDLASALQRAGVYFDSMWETFTYSGPVVPILFEIG